MANLNDFYISSFKQTKFVSLRTMPFLLIDICHSPGFADGWSTISDTFCYCWIADRHFWNFSAKVWSRTSWESNLIVQTDARLAVAWPRAIFWISRAFLSCFIGFLAYGRIDSCSSIQQLFLYNIFLSSRSEVGSGIRIALRWEIWSEKGWSVTRKWKTWAALRWYVALIGEFDFETRKHLLQSQNRYLTSTKWLQTLHIAALWPPQSTMVCQTSSNNFCLFVKIGPNILLSASVWLPVLFSRALRRWYGPTAMICDSYLKNQSAGCYWHHKWTREQAGDPKMENLLIESHPSPVLVNYTSGSILVWL